MAEPQREPWQAGLTRVPFWVYQDDDLRRAEQEKIFQGPVWNLSLIHI